MGDTVGDRVMGTMMDTMMDTVGDSMVHSWQCFDLLRSGLPGLDGLHRHQGHEGLVDGVLQRMVILDALVVLKHFNRGRMDQGQGFDLKISDIRAQFYGIIQKIRFRTPLYEDDEGPCVYADGGRKV